jgi:hypothetical protein
MKKELSDEKLCELFGTTLGDVEKEVSALEAGDLSAYDFDGVMVGRPMEEDPLDTIVVKVPHSRVVAIRRITKEGGGTRSDFVRDAIDEKLISLA